MTTADRPGDGRRDDQAGADRHDLTEAVGAAILDARPGPAGGDADDALALVRRTVEAQQVVRDLLDQAVMSARANGNSWAKIGAELGMSRQAVQQRFGRPDPATEEHGDPEHRWLGPVTAFDELGELEIAGRLGWHIAEVGMLRHKMVRTPNQWEHRRAVWSGSTRRHEREGWQVAARAFPWVYLIRDTGIPAEEPAAAPPRDPRRTPLDRVPRA